MRPLLFATVLAALAVAASGCTITHASVPVLADPGTADLDGVWEGTYGSRETGRVGSITLALSADTGLQRSQPLRTPPRS